MEVRDGKEARVVVDHRRRTEDAPAHFGMSRDGKLTALWPPFSAPWLVRGPFISLVSHDCITLESEWFRSSGYLICCGNHTEIQVPRLKINS